MKRSILRRIGKTFPEFSRFWMTLKERSVAPLSMGPSWKKLSRRWKRDSQRRPENMRETYADHNARYVSHIKPQCCSWSQSSQSPQGRPHTFVFHHVQGVAGSPMSKQW